MLPSCEVAHIGRKILVTPKEAVALNRSSKRDLTAFVDLEPLFLPVCGDGAVIGLVQIGHGRTPTLAANDLFHAMPRHRLVWRIRTGARGKRARPGLFCIR